MKAALQGADDHTHYHTKQDRCDGRHLYAEVCQRFRCQVHRLYQGAGYTGDQRCAGSDGQVDTFCQDGEGHTEGHDTFDGLTG